MRATIKGIIVDDESKSRANLKILLEEFCPHVTVVASCQNVAEALEALQLYQVDVVFLDIQMQRETGFDLLSQLPKVTFELIFITAYSDYAIKAFRFSALDYLLKPIDPDELVQAVNKITQRNQRDASVQLELLMRNIKASSTDNFRLAVPTGEGIIFMRLRDIMYCEAMSNYTCFYTNEGSKYVASRPLKEYEEMLEEHEFFRIHNSFLVNLREIKKYIRGEGGYVILNNDATLDVAKRRKEAFISRISGITSLS